MTHFNWDSEAMATELGSSLQDSRKEVHKDVHYVHYELMRKFIMAATVKQRINSVLR